MTSELISDGLARRIAMEWHGGQFSALYSFGSCGAIADLTRLTVEIRRELRNPLHPAIRAELDSLLAYAEQHGERGPVSGWSHLWEE